ncbi:hypothetical protein SAMN05518855_1002282 [Paenibacillus sp. CF384]|nr:hypothetical protein SAMN05518855_1002282 [Paenibacillus sp. CF384]
MQFILHRPYYRRTTRRERTKAKGSQSYLNPVAFSKGIGAMVSLEAWFRYLDSKEYENTTSNRKICWSPLVYIQCASQRSILDNQPFWFERPDLNVKWFC